MSILKKIFKTEKPIIGVVHFMPLPGYKGFVSLELILKKALEDLKALQVGGVHGVILENNYDLPHKIKVSTETVTAMTFLASKIVKKAFIPIGISALWNDYKAALSIAKVTGSSFVRIPVFVDDVKTDFGNIFAVADEAIDFRKKIKADDVAIFADVQVKHSVMIDKNKTLFTSINQAIKKKADAIIITGKWTGDAPGEEKLKIAKQTAKDFPLIVGSGVDVNNLRFILSYVDGAILSTSLKEGSIDKRKRNLKDSDKRISLKKVRDLMQEYNTFFQEKSIRI